MSGIAGIIHFDGAPVQPGQVEKMTAAMAYRGPDGINHWVRGNVALGQCMLRTTPESLEETQPLTNEDASLVLVMDGRVDNWEALRKELLGRGTVLRTRADAELVLRAYETWGRECLAHIDGDFALVIWDAQQKQAFCARDRMGNKPFHYHWDGKTLAFASDLHPILAMPWVSEEPNEDMLAEYLAFEWYSRDETLWNGILRLVAAHRMEVRHGLAHPEQYWDPYPTEALPYTKDADYVEHYRELFGDAVRRTSRSHRPLAIQVSGGLDSSAVFSMAEHLRRSGRLCAPDIDGYTFAFNDDSEANEIAYARAVGEYFGTRIHEIPPSLPPLSWYEERARQYHEFPGYPNGVMCVGLMHEASVKGARVMLTGQGGDQWLQGSRLYYAEELVNRHWHSLKECFMADVSVYGAGNAINWFMRQGLFQILPIKLQSVVRQTIRFGRSGADRVPYWLSKKLQEKIRLRREMHRHNNAKNLHNHSQRRLIEILYDPLVTYVMEKFEHESSLAGLELRHPFFDRAIVQHAFSTPDRMRLRGDTAKYIHIQALQRIMPPKILNRRDRAYFSSAFHNRLNCMKDILSETLPAEHPDWFSAEGMAQLFNSYRNDPGEGRRMWPLWSAFGCAKVLENLKLKV